MQYFFVSLSLKTHFSGFNALLRCLILTLQLGGVSCNWCLVGPVSVETRGVLCIQGMGLLFNNSKDEFVWLPHHDGLSGWHWLSAVAVRAKA